MYLKATFPLVILFLVVFCSNGAPLKEENEIMGEKPKLSPPPEDIRFLQKKKEQIKREDGEESRKRFAQKHLLNTADQLLDPIVKVFEELFSVALSKKGE